MSTNHRTDTCAPAAAHRCGIVMSSVNIILTPITERKPFTFIYLDFDLFIALSRISNLTITCNNLIYLRVLVQYNIANMSYNLNSQNNILSITLTSQRFITSSKFFTLRLMSGSLYISHCFYYYTYLTTRIIGGTQY